MKLLLLILVVILLLMGCVVKSPYAYDRFSERWNGYIWQVDKYETGIFLAVEYADDPHYETVDDTHRIVYVRCCSEDID